MKTRLETGKAYSTCPSCNGTGIDDTDWSGRCVFCGGDGLVEDADEPRDDDEDDADARGGS